MVDARTLSLLPGLQAVPARYVSTRKEWVATAASVQTALRLPNEVRAALGWEASCCTASARPAGYMP